MQVTKGTFGNGGIFQINEHVGFFRVFINGTLRTSRKSFEGALNVVRKIGPIHKMDTQYMEVRFDG